MIRRRLMRIYIKAVPVVGAIFVVGLSCKLLHDTYQATKMTRSSSSPLYKMRDVVKDTPSRWSIFKRINSTVDIYLEKLKHLGKVAQNEAHFEQILQSGENNRFKDQMVKTLVDKTKSLIKKRIIKVHYFNKPDHVSETSFANCPDACTMTWGVGADLSTSDAVMFQGPSLALNYPIPPKKTRGQIWVLHGSEAPVYWLGSLSQWRGVFNWTMAYRRDADIRHSYGEFRKRPTVLSNIATGSPKPSSVNPVGWFVSHCTTSSKREVFVTQLSKYIKIDIYGACGHLTCPFSKYKECLNKYKFYLSLENAICSDYITEKVFNIYQIASNTIPVVRGFKGQASMFLPPGSYISTDDFTSPSELSKFIETISRNNTAFQSYFHWKKFYESYGYEPNPFCELCRKLHRSESYRRLYYDVEAWLKGENQAFCGSIDDV